MVRIRIPVKSHIYAYMRNMVGDPVVINSRTHPLFYTIASLLEPTPAVFNPVVQGPFLTIELGCFRNLDTRRLNHLSAESIDRLVWQIDQVYFNQDFFTFMDFGKYRMGLEEKLLISAFCELRGILLNEEVSEDALIKRYDRYKRALRNGRKINATLKGTPVLQVVSQTNHIFQSNCAPVWKSK